MNDNEELIREMAEALKALIESHPLEPSESLVVGSAAIVLAKAEAVLNPKPVERIPESVLDAVANMAERVLNPKGG